jgi:hypothetical protein
MNALKSSLGNKLYQCWAKCSRDLHFSDQGWCGEWPYMAGSRIRWATAQFYSAHLFPAFPTGRGITLTVCGGVGGWGGSDVCSSIASTVASYWQTDICILATYGNSQYRICRHIDRLICIGDIKSELLGFRTLSIIRYSKNYKTRCFRHCICFCSQVRGGDTYCFGSLRKS